MRVLAVAANKGGVGKTQVCKSVATAAAAAGLNVVILDTDSQVNATAWGERRAQLDGKDMPHVLATDARHLKSEIERMRKAGCDLVVIDTPPGRGTEAPAAIEVADLVLIPCAAEDVDSYNGIPPTAKVAQQAGTPAAGLLNFVTPGSTNQEKTGRAVMEAVGIPFVPVVLHRYMIHRDANPKGLTGPELEPDSQVATEVAELWAWIDSQLGQGKRQ